MKVTTPVSSVEIVEDNVSALDVVKEIANRAEHEEPFFVVDLSDIVKKHKIWKLKLPRVEPFYAVKCNDTSMVLQVLAALGIGFDCASKGEIQKVLDLGVDNNRIIYANPCKTLSFIKYAACQGVSLMTFDNEAELHKIKAVFPTAKLVIRIRCDDTKARCPLGVKFGVEAEKAVELLKIAKLLELNVVGVSFHVGSGCEDPLAYHTAIKSCRGLFNSAEQLGFNFDLLDLGGGFPGHKNSIVAFNEMASAIDGALDEFFPVGCGVRIIAEPGRYYVASAFTLCTNVIGKRTVQADKGGEVSHMYYINDGVYGSFNCLLYDHIEVNPLPLKEPKWAVTAACSIWGPTCDGLDRVVQETILPVMDIGDWMFFEGMGAYTVAAGSTFNGFQKPGLNFIASESTWLYLQQEMELNMGQVSSPVPVMKTGIDVSVEDILLESRPMFSEISVVDV